MRILGFDLVLFISLVTTLILIPYSPGLTYSGVSYKNFHWLCFCSGLRDVDDAL